jgi:hypothetical protein
MHDATPRVTQQSIDPSGEAPLVDAFPRREDVHHVVCGDVRWSAGTPGPVHALEDIDVPTGDWDVVFQVMHAA